MDRSEREQLARIAEQFERFSEFPRRVLDSINTHRQALEAKMSRLLDEFEGMKADVARQTTVLNSWKVWQAELDAHLAELEAKPAADLLPEDIAALRSKLNENSDAIAAALVKRTDAGAEVMTEPAPMQPVAPEAAVAQEPAPDPAPAPENVGVDRDPSTEEAARTEEVQPATDPVEG